MILIIAFIASLIPSLALFFWLRSRKGQQEGYTEGCGRSLIAGLLSVFPVILVSAALHILGRLLHIGGGEGLLYQAYYKFIVLALAEEVVKFLTFRKVLRKYRYSWLMATVFMVIVGLGFEISEAIPYAIGASVPVMIVRGVTAMHAGFALITGYFYGRSLYTGNKASAVFGFSLAWLLHGTYDYMLSDEFFELSDVFGFIALLIALLCAVLLVVIVVFVRKALRSEKYTKILSKAPDEA